jgi:uncharacterized membrane protein YqjE
MIHPLFRLVAAEPQMVAEHLGGYCELLGDELKSFGSAWSRRLLLQIAALALGAVAVVLCGVALMFWATTAPADLHAAWVLIAAPLVPLLAAFGCWFSAHTGASSGHFAALRQQFSEDARLLREAQTP